MRRKLFLFFALIALTLFLRVFFFEPYRIASSSMESTILETNWVLVSKLSYGARIPTNISEIPFGLLFSAIFKCGKNEKWDFPNYSRAKGIDTVKRYDVILLKNPSNLLGTYVKRCIGMPGETIAISSDTIFINKGVLKGYLGNIYLSNSVANCIKSFNDKSLYIPHKGVVLTPPMLYSFIPLINKFEEHSIEMRKEGVFLNNKKINKYLFKMNYYYVMGDNRFNSRDSRWFGLVPESCVLGKVIFNFSKFKAIKS